MGTKRCAKGCKKVHKGAQKCAQMCANARMGTALKSVTQVEGVVRFGRKWDRWKAMIQGYKMRVVRKDSRICALHSGPECRGLLDWVSCGSDVQLNRSVRGEE
jgi:hypothetical protein